MDGKRKCFSVIWKIKNFSFGFNDPWGVSSPIFFVHSMCQTKWYLRLDFDVTTYKDCVACCLERVSDDLGPDQLELDYELSFLTIDESIIHSKIFLKNSLKKGDRNISSELFEKREDIFVHKKKLFISDDTLTIRCRMWKSQGSISESAKCSAESQIITESKIFVGEIEKFSSLRTNSINTVCSKSPGNFPLSSIHLCVRDDGQLAIEIKPGGYEYRAVYKLKVYILDVFKNKVKSCEEAIYNRQPFSILLTFSKDYLIENKELYLPNDKLTLYGEVSFTSFNLVLGNLRTTEHVVYQYDCEDILAAKTNATNTNPYSEKCHTESRSTLMDDLISLFTEGILCDTKLKTVTESFPAHTAVLSARSPVFKSMFSTDMREKASSCVDIEDLDAETVRKMLIFIYSDTLDNLDYESAKNLYFAADKYNIVSLRHECSDFLKQNLLHSNCCEVLLLADKHQDIDLKRCVQDCISENDEAVLFSDEWKNLEENHSRLTTETLRNIYMKNRKT